MFYRNVNAIFFGYFSLGVPPRKASGSGYSLQLRTCRASSLTGFPLLSLTRNTRSPRYHEALGEIVRSNAHRSDVDPIRLTDRKTIVPFIDLDLLAVHWSGCISGNSPNSIRDWFTWKIRTIFGLLILNGKSRSHDAVLVLVERSPKNRSQNLTIMNRQLCFSLSALFAIGAHAQTIQLFYNDFTMPLSTPVSNCGPDLCITQVNTLWQGTGTGTGGGGTWKQVNTVETILINGPNDIYTDTTGQGGDYCLGMLSTFQDDRVALTLFSDTLPYVNLYMDVAPIDLVACGGPFGTATPSFHIMVFDSPGGTFNINNPGVPLDEDTVFGGPAVLDPHYFAWTQVQTGLDVSGSTDGYVSVMWDLLTSGYAAFDNLLIEASVSGVGIGQHERNTISITVHPNPASGSFTLDQTSCRQNRGHDLYKHRPTDRRSSALRSRRTNNA